MASGSSLSTAPRASCSGWIAQILDGKPHVAIALDRSDMSSIRAAAEAVAGLLACGLPIDGEAFLGRLAAAEPPATPQGRRMRIEDRPSGFRLAAGRAAAHAGRADAATDPRSFTRHNCEHDTAAPTAAEVLPATGPPAHR